MTNLATEVIESIEDGFSSDEEMIKDTLFYLYHTTNDDTMQRKVVDWFNENHYCIECGNELTYYEWEEPRAFDNYVIYETMGCYDCPYCNNERRY